MLTTDEPGKAFTRVTLCVSKLMVLKNGHFNFD